MEILEKIQNIVGILNRLGAKNVEALDITGKSKDIKALIICSFNSEEEVKNASADFLEETKLLGFELLHKDGLTKGQWVVLDFNDILIEIFYEPLREKYNLEKLWKDGKNSVLIDKQKDKKVKK